MTAFNATAPLPRPDDAALAAAAKAADLRIATAESCTGGMLAAALTDLSGASEIFDRGFVTYTVTAKIEVLGVEHATLDAHGAVSEPVARQMAEGALARSEAGLAVSVTGIAGPGGAEGKPEGRVCFGLARTGRPTETETVEFGPRGREAVRAAARDHALGRISEALGLAPTAQRGP